MEKKSPSEGGLPEKKMEKPGGRHGEKPDGRADKKPDELPDPLKSVREAVAKLSPKDAKLKWAALILFGLLQAWLFVELLHAPFSALMKFAGSALLFMVSGELMRGWMGWDGFFGMILFKDRSTLGWIDRQAQKYKEAWMLLADIGLVMGYGLSSYFVLGPEQRKWKSLLVRFGVGLPMLLAFSLFVAPTALSVITSMFSHGEFGVSGTLLRASLPGQEVMKVPLMGRTMYLTPFMIVMLVVLLAGGLAATAVVSLLAYAYILAPPLLGKFAAILISIVTGKAETGGYVPPPGGAPLLPGINLPFVEGILALAVLLVVHEMSHGFLARIAKVRLDSAGIVFFGLLPFGAFVDPDEKELFALKAHEVNRVLVAGSTANIITAILTFVLLAGMVMGTSSLRLEGWRVVSGPIPAGAMVQAIDGINFSGQNLTLPANTSVVVKTSMGDFTRTTDETGHVGIQMEYVYRSGAGFRFQYAPGWEWMGFFLTLLGLIFALDTVVGVVNLLPIPLFDGHRLMTGAMPKKWMGEALSWIVAGAFVLNFLPWLFK